MEIIKFIISLFNPFSLLKYSYEDYKTIKWEFVFRNIILILLPLIIWIICLICHITSIKIDIINKIINVINNNKTWVIILTICYVVLLACHCVGVFNLLISPKKYIQVSKDFIIEQFQDVEKIILESNINRCNTCVEKGMIISILRDWILSKTSHNEFIVKFKEIGPKRPEDLSVIINDAKKSNYGHLFCVLSNPDYYKKKSESQRNAQEKSLIQYFYYFAPIIDKISLQRIFSISAICEDGNSIDINNISTLFKYLIVNNIIGAKVYLLDDRECLNNFSKVDYVVGYFPESDNPNHLKSYFSYESESEVPDNKDCVLTSTNYLISVAFYNDFISRQKLGFSRGDSKCIEFTIENYERILELLASNGSLGKININNQLKKEKVWLKISSVIENDRTLNGDTKESIKRALKIWEDKILNTKLHNKMGKK